MEKDKLFESHVDIIKYKVLRELARQTWAGRDAFMAFNDIANVVVKKGEPPSRCCIYKDRAIIAERIRIGLGEYHGSKDTVQVVSIACDECPKSGHVVTSLCRGCLAHYCRSAWPKGGDCHRYQGVCAHRQGTLYRVRTLRVCLQVPCDYEYDTAMRTLLPGRCHQ